MLKIYLLRHGQDEDNLQGILNGRRDTDLTEKGQQQAQSMADKLKTSNFEFTRTYSSPLIRAYKTASIITEKLGIEKPRILDDLIERDFGIMTGKPVDSIKAVCAPNVIETNDVTYFLSPPGAETFPDLIIRAKKILKYLGNLYQDGDILLVTHGDVGKMIYCAYYNLNWLDVLRMFHFANTDVLLMSPESDAKSTHLFPE